MFEYWNRPVSVTSPVYRASAIAGVRGNPRYLTLRSRGGKEFSGGVFVGTENAPLGMFAHDFFHALGGVYGNKRMVPCLYNFERQAEASRTHRWEYCTDYMGTWDVMSAHYVGKDSAPGISSFTRIRLGWITPEQALLVRPGEEKGAFLAPPGQRGEDSGHKNSSSGRAVLFGRKPGVRGAG